jgi:hypothetical protein
LQSRASGVSLVSPPCSFAISHFASPQQLDPQMMLALNTRQRLMQQEAELALLP